MVFNLQAITHLTESALVWKGSSGVPSISIASSMENKSLSLNALLVVVVSCTLMKLISTWFSDRCQNR